MSPEEALQHVLDKLEDCGIDYMITGSFASNMHGVPRTTYDADIVIEIETGSLDKFIRSLGNEFYASLEVARAAVSSRSMFNVILSSMSPIFVNMKKLLPRKRQADEEGTL